MLAALTICSLAFSPCEQTQTPAASSDQDGGCPEESCKDSLEIEAIRADNENFSAGSYKFTLAASDGSFQPVETNWIECYMWMEGDESDCPAKSSDMLSARSVESGRRLLVSLADSPKTVEVTVEYNGTVIGQTSITPDYGETQAVQTGCATCLEAEESIAVTQW